MVLPGKTPPQSNIICALRIAPTGGGILDDHKQVKEAMKMLPVAMP
jgi:hypothetical protein